MLRKRYALMSPEGGEGGGGAPAPAPAPTPPAPETFSATYVKELRQESAGYRLRAQEAEKKAVDAADAAKKAAEEATGKIEEASKSAQLRIIKAELKAFAVKAGIVDLDGLAFIDMTKVKLSDAGEIEGADEAIDALRKAKPYLFTKTTASTTKVPEKTSTESKKVTELPEAEYRAERRRQFGL
jgi:hypothetical protein